MFATFLHYTRVIDRVVISSPASLRAAESRAAIQTGALMDDGQAKQESAITIIKTTSPVIASEANQLSAPYLPSAMVLFGLPRRFAPRKDDVTGTHKKFACGLA